MMRRTMIAQFFRHEQIRTTEAKAKSIRAQAEKMITLARNRGDADRLIDLAESGDEETLNRLLTEAQARRLLREAEAGETDALEQEARAIAVHAQRLVARDLHDREVVNKLFHDIAPRYLERPGGYTRMVKLGMRKGDAARMVQLMLVEEEL
jgi:large subunit ribosomal protein L17